MKFTARTRSQYLPIDGFGEGNSTSYERETLSGVVEYNWKADLPSGWVVSKKETHHPILLNGEVVGWASPAIYICWGDHRCNFQTREEAEALVVAKGGNPGIDVQAIPEGELSPPPKGRFVLYNKEYGGYVTSVYLGCHETSENISEAEIYEYAQDARAESYGYFEVIDLDKEG